MDFQAESSCKPQSTILDKKTVYRKSDDLTVTSWKDANEIFTM